eukprot:10857527-Alexandrium_andersonii.AAC.1
MLTSCRRRWSISCSGPRPQVASQAAPPAAIATARGSLGAPRTPWTTPRADSTMGGPPGRPEGGGHALVEAGPEGPIDVEHAGK